MKQITNIDNSSSQSPQIISSPLRGTMINELDFLSFIKVKKGSPPRTIKLCRIRIAIINRWLAGRPITTELMELFISALQDRGLKNNSLNSYIFVLRQYRDYCIDRNFDSCFFNGFKSFKKNKPEIIIFSLEEIKKILSVKKEYKIFRGKDCSFLDDVYNTLWTLVAFTGCRPSEALELKVKNLDIGRNSVQFVDTKTNENRTNFFNDSLKIKIEHLIKGKSPESLVFTNTLGNNLHEQDLNKDLKERAKKASIIKRANPYNFRHSYITHQLEFGIPIQVVASLVGHKDIRTTYSTYMHLADQTLRKAAMRHPLVRQEVQPIETLNQIKEDVESFHLESDPRFQYAISMEKNKLNICISY